MTTDKLFYNFHDYNPTSLVIVCSKISLVGFINIQWKDAKSATLVNQNALWANSWIEQLNEMSFRIMSKWSVGEQG